MITIYPCKAWKVEIEHPKVRFRTPKIKRKKTFLLFSPKPTIQNFGAWHTLSPLYSQKKKRDDRKMIRSPQNTNECGIKHYWIPALKLGGAMGLRSEKTTWHFFSHLNCRNFRKFFIITAKVRKLYTYIYMYIYIYIKKVP